jgi:hypothetical protein
MEGSDPSEMKEETTNNSLSALNIGALTTLGAFGCISQRKMMMINLDWLTRYQGATQNNQS